MNLTVLKNIVTSKAARQLLLAQKHAPTIMFGSGVVGVVATAVFASKATLELDRTLDTVNGHILECKRALADTTRPDYSDKSYKHDMIILRTRAVVEIAKLYAPALACGAASIALLTGSHVILQKRNAGLAAAYAAVDKAFKQYQKRVADEFGEEKEREIRYDAREVEILEETETGPDVKRVKRVGPEAGYSPYAKLFDMHNQNWVSNPDYNLIFLKAQQQYANDKLNSQGHLILNDVYVSLGLPQTKEGAVVGWVLGKGDQYVDFGIFNGEHQERVLAFMTGAEKSIWLDFNVCGVMYDLI